MSDRTESHTAEWYEQPDNVFSDEDCARFAVPIEWDDEGYQTPCRSAPRWAQLVVLAFQRCYESALETQNVNGVECVVVDAPTPALDLETRQCTKGGLND